MTYRKIARRFMAAGCAFDMEGFAANPVIIAATSGLRGLPQKKTAGAISARLEFDDDSAQRDVADVFYRVDHRRTE